MKKQDLLKKKKRYSVAQKYKQRAIPWRGRTKSKPSESQIRGGSKVCVGTSETQFTMKEGKVNKVPSSFMGNRKSSKIQES